MVCAGTASPVPSIPLGLLARITPATGWQFPLSASCNLVKISSPEALTDWRSFLDTVVLGASWAQMGIPGGVMLCIKNKKSSKLF